MPKRQKFNFDTDSLTKDLQDSKGKGVDALFSTPPPESENIEIEKPQENTGSNDQPTTKITRNTKINKENNTTSNIESNITILQITEKDIEDLRDPAEKVQSYRLNPRDIEYIRDIAYELSKESKRGKIGQGDILRIALVLFDKFITADKKEVKKILEKIK